MAIHTCDLCGSDFLTEADPYVVKPNPAGVELYCVCQIRGLEEMKEVQKLKREIEQLYKTIKNLMLENDKLINALQFYAEYQNDNPDNEYNNELARQVLKEIGEE